VSAQNRPERIGILGGTFDPIHAGHLAAAEAAIECAQLDRVIFVPAGSPPHRPAAIAPAADRLEMARQAVAGDARYAVSDLELHREGPSFTLDTLLELRRTYTGADLFLILGWDAARLFRSWHEPERVRDLATVVVIGRPGLEAPGVTDVGAVGLDPARTVLCLRATPAVSASEIRRLIGGGGSIEGLVPTAVADYIAAHHLYRG
jgi:nicotinate-nucleotide adenylyltransferase